MAITEYNYIPTYIKRTINNKPKDVIRASYWNELFNLLINQGDHTAKELGNVLNHFTAAINDVKGIVDGKYVKPTDGIPKTDLAAAVQTSLDKADSALQTHQSLAAYRTAFAQDVIDSDLGDRISAIEGKESVWNGKQDKLIAGDNITIAADGKTISVINCSDKILSVTITGYTDAEIVADKTYAEIKAAIDSGYPIHTIDNNGDIFVPRVNFKSDVERITLAWTERLDSNTWVEVVYEVNTQDSWGVTLREYVTPSEIGNLIALKTQAKDNLVVAINEVKQTTDAKQDKLIAGENITIAADGKTISAIGGSSASIAMRVNGGYIQYSTDNGNTWSNLIAEADIKGDKGDTGLQGPQGVKGDKGDTGPQGLQGIQGPKGDKGDKGDTGPQGPIGETGPVGPAGPQGPKGNTGDTGFQGDTGPQGPKGDKGDTGADGISLYTTTQDSALETTPFDIIYITTNDRTLVVGDLILTPTGRLYRVTSVSTSFVDTEYITSLRGPQGIKGDKGDKGDTGAIGPQGIQGVQGPQGERGPAGADGAIGPQGPKGDKGDTGLQGPQGVKGDKGDKGDTGPQGLQGPSGVSPTISLEETASGVMIDVSNPDGTSSSSYVLHGQSAYDAARNGGYTDTQANFYTDLAAVQGLASALAAI